MGGLGLLKPSFPKPCATRALQRLGRLRDKTEPNRADVHGVVKILDFFGGHHSHTALLYILKGGAILTTYWYDVLAFVAEFVQVARITCKGTSFQHFRSLNDW